MGKVTVSSTEMFPGFPLTPFYPFFGIRTEPYLAFKKLKLKGYGQRSPHANKVFSVMTLVLS
jgi:hypothetical protein